MSWIELSANQRVLLTTALLGFLAGVVGSYAVLRRRALVGDMIGHAAWPGICLGYLLLAQTSIPRNSLTYFFVMLICAAGVGLLGVGFMTFVCRWTKTKEDAAIGIVLSVFFGGGIVLHSLIQNQPGSGRAGLKHFLEGSAATIRDDDLVIVMVLFVLSLSLVGLFYKEFKVFSFDPDFARSQGWPILVLDLVMMGALCLVTIMALPVVGVVLVTGMLIIPCAAARYWTNRLGRLLVLSGLLGAAAGICGTALSIGAFQGSSFGDRFGFLAMRFGNQKHLPTGPLIIVCGTLLFVLSMTFAPQRGLLARALGGLRLRLKTAGEHLLRSLYELNEPFSPQIRPILRAALLRDRAWTPAQLRWLLWLAGLRGEVRQTDSGIQLTDSGFQRAAALTRRHRLWELFLIQDAGIAADHVDRDADSVEHYLSADLTRQLEDELASQGRLPPTEVEMPSSPHELPVASGISHPSHEAGQDTERG